MRRAALLVAPAALATAQGINFVDTTIQSPMAVGQTAELMWSTGNGQSINLALANASWISSIFNGRAVSPARYTWTLGMIPGLVSGDYYVVLTQDGEGGTQFEPVTIAVSPGTSAPMPSMWPNATATTVTVWDDDCTCHMTSTIMPTPTSIATISCPHTTSTWTETECGCMRTALVPLPSTASSNYTAPSQPPAPPAMTTPSMGTAAPPPSSPTPLPSIPYANGAIKAVMSIAALLAGLVAFSLAFH